MPPPPGQRVQRSPDRRAHRNSQAFTLLEQQVALLHSGIEAAGLGFVALADDGRIVFATPVAARLLQRYFEWKGSSRRLPSPLVRWLAAHWPDRRGQAFVVGGEVRTLSVRLLRHTEQPLFVLRETPRRFDPVALEAFGLTPRQAEVLGWVTEAKTDPEIAAILGISPRTVNHHLEVVYRKLGVETRAAAAQRANEIVEWSALARSGQSAASRIDAAAGRPRIRSLGDPPPLHQSYRHQPDHQHHQARRLRDRRDVVAPTTVRIRRSGRVRRGQHHVRPE